ncbi:nonstructural protein [Munia coronavirus HKU13-3514]|uniref:Nonstructural protein n=1 Tax=Munia coronavirus HKU13 TaxID=1297661 RepID=B6VDZ0_9NIDO|nr:nonstructural protein [Munia coronavirus HKU13-3514]ACJ12065.1 nonstructural protein [Munia coronavirus HKU13-3514]
MCNCIYQLQALYSYCKTHVIQPDDIFELCDTLVKPRCFAYSTVVFINANPIAFSILPRQLLINDEPLFIEYGSVRGSDFIIRPSLQVVLEEEISSIQTVLASAGARHC